MVGQKKQHGPFGKFRILNVLDRFLITEMHQWGIPVLRVALGIVFLWFGALKVWGATPVANLVTETYSFFPTETFLLVLGWWEVMIGVGLLTHHFLRAALALLWLQMAGTFFAVTLSPTLFFLEGNPLLLSIEGEFIVKNIVLISAG